VRRFDSEKFPFQYLTHRPILEVGPTHLSKPSDPSNRPKCKVRGYALRIQRIWDEGGMCQVISLAITMKLPTTKLWKIRPATCFQEIQEGRFFNCHQKPAPKLRRQQLISRERSYLLILLGTLLERPSSSTPYSLDLTPCAAIGDPTDASPRRNSPRTAAARLGIRWAKRKVSTVSSSSGESMICRRSSRETRR
jgi:hypothetical protein